MNAPDATAAETRSGAFPPPVDFKVLFEGLPGLFIVLDPALIVVAASDAYVAAARVQRSKLVGQYLFDVFPENTHVPDADATRPLRASLDRVLRTRQPEMMAIQRHDLPRPDGGFDVRYWSPLNSPLLAADGSVAYLVHRVEDVTDYMLLKQEGGAGAGNDDGLCERMQRAEAELHARSRDVETASLRLRRANEELARVHDEARSREAEMRYRDLFNAIGEGFCTIQVLFDEKNQPVDYLFLDVNPAFAQHTGIADAIGRRMREIDPGVDEHWFRIYGEVARSGKPARLVEHSAALGRWFQINAFRVGEPERHQVAVLFSDVTASYRAAEALRESEERFRAVADNIPQLAWMTAADGSILWFNRRWFDYTGMSLEDMQRLGWQEVHHPEHPTSVAAGWVRALETGEPWEDTFPLRGRDGTFRWFLSRAFPIRDGQGEITRWFGTNTDITPLREAQAALRKAHEDLQLHAQNLESMVAERTAQLSEKVQELEAFSYSLSHDMRAPLRAMQGYAQILDTDYARVLGEEGHLFVRRIAIAASRLDHLIQDVLAYSRVVREHVDLHPIDVAQLIHAIVEENSRLQPPNAVIAVSAPLHAMCGHEASLTQVLSNLLYNAVKFVPSGRQPHVRIWTEAGEDHVELFVADNGVGIPPAARERLFGMFQRFHQELAVEGNGIGLAIVRKAVERMGGSVRVESEPGEGSTFIVRLNRPARERAR